MEVLEWPGGVANQRKSLSGSVLDGFGAFWGSVAPFWMTFSEKLGCRLAQHEPSWSQVDSNQFVATMGHVTAKMAMSDQFGRCAGYQKNMENQQVSKILDGFGVVGWVC